MGIEITDVSIKMLNMVCIYLNTNLITKIVDTQIFFVLVHICLSLKLQCV